MSLRFTSMKTTKALLLCSSGTHVWSSEFDAQRCCNGWVRILAPWLYGSEHIPKRRWYEPGSPAIYAPALVESHRQDEITRLLEISPEELRLAFESQSVLLH